MLIDENKTLTLVYIKKSSSALGDISSGVEYRWVLSLFFHIIRDEQLHCLALRIRHHVVLHHSAALQLQGKTDFKRSNW